MKKNIYKTFLTLLFIVTSILSFSCENNVPVNEGGVFFNSYQMDENICRISWYDYSGADGYNLYTLIRQGTSGDKEDIVNYGKKIYLTDTAYDLICCNSGNVFVYVEAVKANGKVIATSQLKRDKVVDLSFFWDYTNTKKDIKNNSIDFCWNKGTGANLYRVYHLENDEKSNPNYKDVINTGKPYETENTTITINNIDWSKNNYFAIVSFYIDENGNEYRLYESGSLYHPDVIENVLSFDWDDVYQEDEYLNVFWTDCPIADKFTLYYTYNPDNYDDFRENYDSGKYTSYTVTKKGYGVKIKIDDTSYYHKYNASNYIKTYYLMVVAYCNDEKISTPDSGIKIYHTGEPDRTENITWVKAAPEAYLENTIELKWYNVQYVEDYKIYVLIDNSSATKTADEVIYGATDTKRLYSYSLGYWYWEYAPQDKGKYAHFAIEGLNNNGAVIARTKTTKTVRLQ